MKMNTVKAVIDLKCGLLQPRAFKYLQTTKRVQLLSLSKCQDIENVHTAGINSLDVDAVEGRYLLSGAADGTIYIHDLYNLSGSMHYTCKTVSKVDRRHKHCHKYSVECVQWYPVDTGIFLSSGMDRCLKIWDANRLVPADVFLMEGKIYYHHMATSTTKHSLVAVASTASQVLLADLRSGSRTHELRNHSSSVLTVKWSPRNEYHLASGSMDNRLLMWDVRSSRNCLLSFDQNNRRNGSNFENSTAHNGYVHGISFTYDGLYLLSIGTDGRMRLWNSETGRNEMVNYGKIPMESKKGVRFDISCDTEPQMVFVPSQGNIYIYELVTGIRRNTLLGHYNTVTCCIYNDQYQTLYSGANDRNVLVWTSDSDQSEEEVTVRDLTSRSLLPKNRLTEDAWSSDDD